MKRPPPLVLARGSGGSRPVETVRRTTLKPALMIGAMLLLLLQLLVPAAFATIIDPDYTRPILDPATQPKYTAAQAIPRRPLRPGSRRPPTAA